MTTKTITILAITAFLIILTCLSYPKVKTFFAIDSCLDQGEKWDYKRGRCEQEIEKNASKQTLKNRRIENTEVLNFPCAVLIQPNSEKIEKLKKENSEDDYNTIVDDNLYYMSTSIEYLDSVKVKRVERQSEGSVTFKTTKGVVYKFNVDSLYWGILLFNGREKPIESDMTYINQDYESYMKK